MNIRIYLTMKGQWNAGSFDHFNSPAGSELGEEKSPNLAAMADSTGGISNTSLPVKYGCLRSCARKMTRIISSRRGQPRGPEEIGADGMIMHFSSKHKSVRSQISLTERSSRPSAGGRHVNSSIYAGQCGRVRRVGLDEREMKKRDDKYTRASVMMVLVYIACQAPRVLLNLTELYTGVAYFYSGSIKVSKPFPRLPSKLDCQFAIWCIGQRSIMIKMLLPFFSGCFQHCASATRCRL